MSDPHVFKVVRPYQSVEEYLEAEASWLQAKWMLVPEAEELPAETVVRFGVDLESGESVIRAEGRVVEYVEAKDDTPAGLKVRFKRYGASTKAVLEQAKAIRAKNKKRPSEAKAEEEPPPELDSSPELTSVPLQPPPDPPQRDSGVHQRVRGPVDAPANREELLERLRQRARDRSSEVEAVAVAAKA